MVYKLAGRRYPKTRSYAMNGMINSTVYLSGTDRPGIQQPPSIPRYGRDAEIPHPVKVFLFVEIDPASICWADFEMPDRGASSSKHARAFHSKGSVLVFADGHAGHHRWEKPIFGREPNPAPKPDPHPVVLTRNDVNWMRVRSHHTAGDF